MTQNNTQTDSETVRMDRSFRRPLLTSIGMGALGLIAGCIGTEDADDTPTDVSDDTDIDPAEPDDDGDTSNESEPSTGDDEGDNDYETDTDADDADDGSQAQDDPGDDDDEEESSIADLMSVNLNEEGLSAGEDIGPYFEEYVGRGVDITIEPGTYEWNTFRDDTLSMGNGSITGKGDWGDVVLELETSSSGGNRFQPDFYAEGGDAQVTNLKMVGRIGFEDSSEKINVSARYPDDQIVLNRVGLVDGIVPGSTAGGMYISGGNQGTHRFEDCVSHLAGDNGMYIDGSGGSEYGPIEVIGGYYKNSNISDLRVGGDDVHVQGVTIVHDADTPEGSTRRPLRFRQPGENMLIEDCDFYITRGDGMSAIIDWSSRSGFTAGTIRNCRIYNETDTSVIGASDLPPEGDWTVENLHLTGPGSHELAESENISFGEILTGDDADEASPEPRRPIGNRA